MRISDWSSDVCSSDLLLEPPDELLACGARYRTDGSGHQAGEKVDGTAVLDEGMAGGALGGAREHVGVGRAAALGVGIAAIRRQLDQQLDQHRDLGRGVEVEERRRSEEHTSELQ